MNYRLKRTKSGYPLNKNGKPILSLPEGAIVKYTYNGVFIKENGTYYYYEGKRGEKYIYTL